jgi:hypothetical protein
VSPRAFTGAAHRGWRGTVTHLRHPVQFMRGIHEAGLDSTHHESCRGSHTMDLSAYPKYSILLILPFAADRSKETKCISDAIEGKFSSKSVPFPGACRGNTQLMKTASCSSSTRQVHATLSPCANHGRATAARLCGAFPVDEFQQRLSPHANKTPAEGRP